MLTETSGRLRSRLLSTTADGSRRCARLLSTLRAVHQEDMFLFCGFSFLLGLSVCTVRIYTAKWQLWACERDFRALKYHLWSSTSSGQSLCFFSDFFCVWKTKVTVSLHTDRHQCCVRCTTTGHLRLLWSSAATRQCRLPIWTEQQRLKTEGLAPST